jgi:hypothetical protein
MATGAVASVSGGDSNTASGNYSSISGGQSNSTTTGTYSSVSGGHNRSVGSLHDWRAGTLWEDN